MIQAFHDRAAEILAAYGGDPARWPDDERAMVVAALAASPELSAARMAAVALDGDLAAWAHAPVVPGDMVRATQAVLATSTARPRPYLRWAMGTGLAASLAATLVVLTPARTPPITPTTPVAMADDAAAFAEVFTPTPDEEQIL